MAGEEWVQRDDFYGQEPSGRTIPRVHGRHVAVRTVVPPGRRRHDLRHARLAGRGAGTVPAEAALAGLGLRLGHQALSRVGCQEFAGVCNRRRRPILVGILEQDDHHALFLSGLVVVLEQRSWSALIVSMV